MTTKKIPISKKTVSVTVDPVNFSDDDVKFLDFEDSRSFEKLVVERNRSSPSPRAPRLILNRSPRQRNGATRHRRNGNNRRNNGASQQINPPHQPLELYVKDYFC
ncbi:12879_t:CDS:2 [Funneliformis geosporum]|uniref:12879_t:CDS:1 n=1 Tax=Funneliformis geosporum TaxID=1117311 RepID=A0A9W4T0Y0_9GLOM|nr:12879_t:CDS:2 [Funneliformis geosporum]